MLGERQVGKTNYLVTLHQQLRLLDLGFTYSDDDTIQNYLRKYDRLWYPGMNNNTREFCMSTSENSLLHYSIRYNNKTKYPLNIYSFDYVGETTKKLADSTKREIEHYYKENNDENIYKILSASDIIFIFLDSKVLENYCNHNHKYDPTIMRQCIQCISLDNHIRILKNIKKARIDEALHVSLILTKIDDVNCDENTLKEYVRNLWNDEISYNGCQSSILLLGIYASTVIGKNNYIYENGEKKKIFYQAEDGKYKIHKNAKLRPQNILTPLFDSIIKYADYCSENNIELEKKAKIKTVKTFGKEYIQNIATIVGKKFGFTKEIMDLGWLTYSGFHMLKKRKILEEIYSIQRAIEQIKKQGL